MLLGLAVVLGAVAWLLTGLAGVLRVLVTVLLLGALRPRVPTAWVLSMYQAQPLPRWAAPRLHEVVDVLSVRARLHRRAAPRARRAGADRGPRARDQPSAQRGPFGHEPVRPRRPPRPVDVLGRALVGRSGGPDPLLLQTHPGTEQRVHRLRALGAGPSRRPVARNHEVTVAYPPVTRRPRLRRTGIWW